MHSRSSTKLRGGLQNLHSAFEFIPFPGIVPFLPGVICRRWRLCFLSFGVISRLSGAFLVLGMSESFFSGSESGAAGNWTFGTGSAGMFDDGSNLGSLTLGLSVNHTRNAWCMRMKWLLGSMRSSFANDERIRLNRCISFNIIIAL